MTGIGLIIVFILAIALMIFCISKLKIHPFLAIMAISLVFGLIAGIPLVNTTDADGNTVSGIANVIGAGFSGTFSSIGIVIIFGALVGTLLESTGAALKMADCVVKLVGKKHPELAIELMGWIVSIPVFCDSGFVVLNPIRKAMARRTGASSVAMSVALSMGLYISHCFIPPTPGPIAAAGTLGCGDNLLLVMGLGALCSIPPLVAGYFFAKYIGKKVKAADDIVADGDVKTYEQLVAEFGKLPSGWLAFAPIVLPIILMGLASAFSMAGVKADFISFLGTPIIALAVGCIIAIISLFAANKGKDFYKLTDDTLKTVGPIPVRHRCRRRAGQGHRVLRHGQLHQGQRGDLREHRHLLPVPAGRHPQIRAGLLYRRHHHHGRYRRAAAAGPGAGFPGAVLPDGHRHRRRRHDGVARERLLLLGRHQLR